jgi:hypothetical protein
VPSPTRFGQSSSCQGPGDAGKGSAYIPTMSIALETYRRRYESGTPVRQQETHPGHGWAVFLGSHLIGRLLARGHEILCVDNLFTDTKRSKSNCEANYCRGQMDASVQQSRRIGVAVIAFRFQPFDMLRSHVV